MNNDKIESDDIREYRELVVFLNETAHDLFSQTDYESGIRRMLTRVRGYFCADRAYILENDHDIKILSNTYEDCAEDIPSEMDNLQKVSFDSCSFWFESIQDNDYINITDVDSLEDDRAAERDILRNHGISSLIAVPLNRDGVAIGFLGVNNPKTNNSHIDRLTALGDYLSIYMSNRDSVSRMVSENERLIKAQLQIKTRQKAMFIASRISELYYWLFYIDKRAIQPLFDDKHPEGFPITLYDMPDSFMDAGHLHQADRTAFMGVFCELSNDAEYCECTVRVMNYRVGRYEWRHIYYMRLPDDMFSERTAIGYSISAALEQENKLRYEREIQLRKEMIKNSVAYFQVNLTSKVVEEYHSKLFPHIYDEPEFNNDKTGLDCLQDKLINIVTDEFRDKVRSQLFGDALLDAYESGESAVTSVFRENCPGHGLKWIRADVAIVERYNSGDIIALIFMYDIDMEKKDQLAIEAIMDEEIESVVVINTETGIAHFAQIRADKSAVYEHKDFNYDEVYSNIINNAVIKEDRKGCEEFFYLDKLKKALEHDRVIKHIYRITNGTGRARRKNNRAFYLDDTKKEIILLRRDITDLYEEEQKQKLMLRKAVNEANIANNAKSEFLWRMSHDMRTPLNAILSFSRDDITAGASKAELRECLDRIHSSGTYLLGIISDVLDMSIIENHKMTLSNAPYQFDDFLNLVNTIIRQSCDEKGISLVTDCSALEGRWIMTDKVRFNQLFINLLSNAVKFTSPGGMIQLMIKGKYYNSDGMEMMRFIVSDNGIGIGSQFIPHAFDNFTQEHEDKATGYDNGTGLGLSIVKKIVELMYGRITLSSVIEEGTTFVVELPVKIVPEPKGSSLVRDAELSLEGVRVLLCEDDDINADIVCQLLLQKGCIIDRAVNGLKGIELFEKSSLGYYNIILMDIRMPEMNGYEATIQIRSLYRKDAARIPIIALTADVFAHDDQVSVEAGLDAYVSKPIDADNLYSLLDKFIYKNNRV